MSALKEQKKESLSNIKTDEIWKDIVDYEGYYQVSNLGNIKSIKRIVNGMWGKRTVNEKIMKQQKDRCGYLRIILKKENNKKIFQVHRLVAESFIPNPNNLPQVNHKDECKTNNCVDNLEWCTAKYNCNYGTRTAKIKEKTKGINKNKHYSPQTEFKKGHKPWNKGKSNYFCAKKVKCVDLNKVYNSMTEASRDLNIKSQNIQRSCMSKYKAGGYKWEYE